jgi:hypothetical protein
MKHKRNWAIGIILSVAATFVALQNVSAPTQEVETPESVVTITITVEPSSTVSVDNSGSCGYMWAYHEDPELTAKFDEAIRQLDPAASANAQQFGEDCVYEDGHSVFSVKETDFYVHFPAEDLNAEENFGNWISQVLQIALNLPREQIKGDYGFVEFWFERSDSEHVIARVPIQRYMDEAKELTGAELFRMFIAP